MAENTRRKGAIDLDNISNGQFTIVDNKGMYLTYYPDSWGTLNIRPDGRVTSYLFKTSLTKAGRCNDMTTFLSEEEAKQFIKDRINDARPYTYGDESMDPAEVKRIAKKYINSHWTIVSVADLKAKLYPIFGEESSGKASTPCVIIRYYEDEDGTRFVDGAVKSVKRGGHGMYDYPTAYVTMYYDEAKVFNSEGLAKDFMSKYSECFTGDDYQVVEESQLKDILAKARQDKEDRRVADEEAAKAAHAEYLQSDAHKEELARGRAKRAADRETKPGKYKVRFYFAHSWLGSEDFTVEANSRDDAFRKAKAQALRRDPYRDSSGYDEKMIFDKSHITFLGENVNESFSKGQVYVNKSGTVCKILDVSKTKAGEEQVTYRFNDNLGHTYCHGAQSTENMLKFNGYTLQESHHRLTEAGYTTQYFIKGFFVKKDGSLDKRYLTYLYDDGAYWGDNLKRGWNEKGAPTDGAYWFRSKPTEETLKKLWRNWYSGNPKHFMVENYVGLDHLEVWAAQKLGDRRWKSPEKVDEFRDDYQPDVKGEYNE